MIDSIATGGLEAFKTKDDDEKRVIREQGIRKFQETCREEGAVGIVAGHHQLWYSPKGFLRTVWTSADSEVYTHIVYLNYDPQRILAQRNADKERLRPVLTLEQLTFWQKSERRDLQKDCYHSGIVFMALDSPPNRQMPEN